MTIIVQKYGGSSVADLDRMKQVASYVAKRKAQGCSLVVVVSAMGKATDDLLTKAKAISDDPPRRELDMLLTAGERTSAALLAIALKQEGVTAVSLTGSQCGIITNDRHVDARIIEVRPTRVQDELERGRVVIVAGFQGMSYRRDITTLGRGGTDTTAVALAAALGAEACEIYSDVDGVLSADPRLVPEAQRIDTIGFPEMQELACAGAKVLNAQAVEFAKASGIALYARKTGHPGQGTLLRLNPPPPAGGVRGVAHRHKMLLVRCPGSSTRELFALLARLGVRTNFIGWVGGADDQGLVDIWCAKDNLHAEAKLKKELQQNIGGVSFVEGTGAVSLIGEGIMDDPSHLDQALAVLADNSITVQGLSTSSFRISVLVASERVEQAVQSLHRAFISGEPVSVDMEP